MSAFPGANGGWAMRYAPHLGYRPPFQPLFAHSVGSEDPVAQVQFAADRGFAGVQYAAARSRSVEEQNTVGEALARHGLEAGCVLYTRFDQLRNTSWGVESDDARSWTANEMRAAIDTAKRVGARRIAVVAAADPQEPIALQRAAMVTHLRFVGDLAAQANMTVCVEALSSTSIPGMLLQRVLDAYAVVKSANHPAIRLIFDTSHVQIMDGDLLFHLEQTWDMVEVVQLADNPGRLEPGSGEINFEAVLQMLARRGYAGLVELEHGWSTSSLESERRGLATLRRLDAVAAAPTDA
jgi:hydroxypyruvate isomerase